MIKSHDCEVSIDGRRGEVIADLFLLLKVIVEKNIIPEDLIHGITGICTMDEDKATTILKLLVEKNVMEMRKE